MKPFVLSLVLAAASAAVSPARAADLRVLAPADKSVVGGRVEFRIQPLDGPTDQFLDNPYVIFKDASGRQVEEVRAPRNRQTGLCSVVVDTTQLKDGPYRVEVNYRTLVGGQPRPVSKELALAVRNSGLRPVRFSVELEAKSYRPEEDAADVTVKVLDQRGKPLPGARVAFKVDQGDLESEAELTDADGEAFVTIQSDEPREVRLTITVEGLTPVMRVIRFAP